MEMAENVDMVGPGMDWPVADNQDRNTGPDSNEHAFIHGDRKGAHND